MTLEDLQAFRELARTGRFSRAARHLGMSPSGLAACVERLERELGQALFERQGESWGLSAQGTVLLEYAQEMLALGDEALRSLHGTVAPGGTGARA